jgi:hypothetical protein
MVKSDFNVPSGAFNFLNAPKGTLILVKAAMENK